MSLSLQTLTVHLNSSTPELGANSSCAVHVLHVFQKEPKKNKQIPLEMGVLGFHRHPKENKKNTSAKRSPLPLPVPLLSQELSTAAN